MGEGDRNVDGIDKTMADKLIRALRQDVGGGRRYLREPPLNKGSFGFQQLHLPKRPVRCPSRSLGRLKGPSFLSPAGIFPGTVAHATLLISSDELRVLLSTPAPIRARHRTIGPLPAARRVGPACRRRAPLSRGRARGHVGLGGGRSPAVLGQSRMTERWMPNGMCGRSRSSRIAFAAAGHGTIRLQELAMPFSTIDDTSLKYGCPHHCG